MDKNAHVQIRQVPFLLILKKKKKKKNSFCFYAFLVTVPLPFFSPWTLSFFLLISWVVGVIVVVVVVVVVVGFFFF